LIEEMRHAVAETLVFISVPRTRTGKPGSAARPTRQVMTMSQPDDPSADDLEKFDDYERHQSAIYDYLSDYMDNHNIDPLYVSDALVDIAVGLRMTSRGVTVENPSVAGLKLELDRFRGELDEIVREATGLVVQHATHVAS
jgi:hypothetical protein